jgi:mono/diheme cytochrome c family protein
MRLHAFATVLMLTGPGIAACGENGPEGDTDTADTDTADTEGVAGDGVRGGALYDAWWEVLGVDAPAADHPLWASRPDAASNTRTGADTWRCKECHGWDYQGKDGAYGSGGHRTGIVGVLGTTMTPSELLVLLSDPNGHAYATVLNAQDLADLALFVAEWTIDTSEYIGESGAFIGDTAVGEQAFASVCAACHGAQGLNTTVVGGDPGFEDFPGLIADDNPPEFLHKIRFGQPGTAMPPQARSMPDVLGDLGAFAQTLPQAP